MPEEETASSSKTANVLRISLPDRLSRLLQAFASRPDAAFGEQNEDDDEVRSEGADEIAAGAEPVNSLSPKWTVGAVDVGAWLAWELVGLRLLSGNRLPNMQAFSTAARWVLLIDRAIRRQHHADGGGPRYQSPSAARSAQGRGSLRRSDTTHRGAGRTGTPRSQRSKQRGRWRTSQEALVTSRGDRPALR